MTHGIRLIAAAGACLSAAFALAEQGGAGAQGRYWEWGWGTYNSGSGLDTARFDWSVVTPVSPAETAKECNDILAINPKHKFLVRVWPILGLGDCLENRQQATFLHYLYQPGVREKVLANVRRQIEGLLSGLVRPDSFAGSVFLEELPCHFSSAPFRKDWSAALREWGIDGAPEDGGLPWDLARFRDQVRADLGAAFNIMDEEHRRWWGRKYCHVLEEIHKEMKDASRGRVVMYWHQTMFSTMDHIAEGQSIFTPGVVPVSYKDIVKPGVCDGIFGYPNSARIWARQTQAPVKQLNCLLFSQLAQKPWLRLCRFKEQVELARWEHPGNLGSFLYLEPGRRWRAWNQLPYPEDGSYWTTRDYSRRFAWDYGIGRDVVDRRLTPEVQLDYSLDGLKKNGFTHVQAQVYNPRHPSWYGGDAELAALRRLKVTLRPPPGFSIPLANNAGATLDLGDLGPGECMPADWWVRLDKDDPSIPAGQGFTVTLAVDGRKGASAFFAAQENRIPSFKPHVVSRSGDAWIEPAYQAPPDYVPVAEIRPLAGEILHPRLVRGDRSALYRGTLLARDRLVIGPAFRATLFRDPLLAKSFAAQDSGTQTEGVFTEGYHVLSSPRAAVTSNKTYRLSVRGWARDGGNCHVIARFTGKRAGKSENVDQSLLANRFTEKPATVGVEIKVPEFDGTKASVVLFFYRLQSKGTVCYQSYELRATDVPEGGVDVTDRLEGVLANIERPFTAWRYLDLSDPEPRGGPKVEVRFLPPEEVRSFLDRSQ